MDDKADLDKRLGSIKVMINTIKESPPSAWAEAFVKSLEIELSNSSLISDKQLDVLIKIYRQCYKV